MSCRCLLSWMRRTAQAALSAGGAGIRHAQSGLCLRARRAQAAWGDRWPAAVTNPCAVQWLVLGTKLPRGATVNALNQLARIGQVTRRAAWISIGAGGRAVTGDNWGQLRGQIGDIGNMTLVPVRGHWGQPLIGVSLSPVGAAHEHASFASAQGVYE
jgi:hypothetical protein